MVDYYAVLGIPRSASEADLRRAYKEQALRHHPDKNYDRVAEATERFKLISEAYDVLRDVTSRAAYDRGWHASMNNCRRGSGTARADAQRASGEWGASQDFTFKRSQDLFREVFGDEVVAQLARMAKTAKQMADAAAPHVQAATEKTCQAFGELAEAAAPHLHAAAAAIGETAKIAGPHIQAASKAAASAASDAADRCGKSEIVKSALANGLSEVLDDAQQHEVFWRGKVANRRSQFCDHQRNTSEYEKESTEACKTRSQRLEHLQEAMYKPVFWYEVLIGAFLLAKYLACRQITLIPLGAILCCLLVWQRDLVVSWNNYRDQHAECIKKESEQIAALHRQSKKARNSLESAEAELANAKGSLDSAARQLESIEQEGASIASTARVGLHYLGSVTGVRGLWRNTKAALR